jgi:hypothetical protein
MLTDAPASASRELAPLGEIFPFSEQFVTGPWPGACLRTGKLRLSQGCSTREVIGMRRLHVAVAAVVVAIAVALGTYTVTRSAALGPTATSAQGTSVTIDQSNRRLNATEAALNRALAERPPAVVNGRVPFIPPQPVVVNVTGSVAATATTPAPQIHFDDEDGGGFHD